MSVRLVTSDIVSENVHKDGFPNEKYGGDGGGGMDHRLAVLEAKVAHIESDVSELKSTVAVVDKNTAVILERLDGIKESLAKKPTSDSVDKKIAEAKVSQIIWTIGSVLAIVSVASGIIIKILHS
ncbi:hypothetical protein [Klebsiella michiganensis]|uniref:hypothetical protein n=1 Tax=Klebsiella michiganensis TaxID=1134687 RepID=UPI001D0E142E|nr:hypothetical protein [Klebsiella michiganensis]